MAGEYQSKWTGAEIDSGIQKANDAAPQSVVNTAIQSLTDRITALEAGGSGGVKIVKGAIGTKINTKETVTFDFTVIAVMFNSSYGTMTPTRWVTAGNTHTSSNMGQFACTTDSISFTPYNSTYVPIPYVVFGVS